MISPAFTLGGNATYTVEHRGGCVLITGAVPASAFAAVTRLAPARSIMDPDAARMLGVTFAIGLIEDLNALKAAQAPAAERRARQAHPGLSDGAVRWPASGARGISSETMFTVLTGVDALAGEHGGHPHDPEDLDRCLKLLAAVPELRPLLPKMAGCSPQWAALIEHWDEIEHSHLDEVGLGWTKASSAPMTYALMRQVLDGAKEAV